MFILKAAYTAKEYYRLLQCFCPPNVIVCFCNCDFIKYLVSIIFHGKLLHDLFALVSLTQFVPISGLFVTLHLYTFFETIVLINARLFNTRLWHCHITFLYLLKTIALISARMFHIRLWHCYLAFLYLLKTISLINAVCFISGFGILTLHFYTYLKQLLSSTPYV